MTNNIACNNERPSQELDHTVNPDVVGLRADRPLRFCTIHYSQAHKLGWTQPGDDPHPENVRPYPGMRSIEFYVPANEETCQVPYHNHEFVELVLIRQGQAVHITPEGENPIQRGSAIIVTQGGRHGFRDIDRIIKTNIYLQPDWLSEDLRLLWGEPGLFRFLLADALFHQNLHGGVWQFELTEEETVACERELAELHREAQKLHPSLALFNGCFLKILWVLNEAFIRKEPDDPIPLRKEVWSAAEQIEGMVRMGTPFHVEEFARRRGMSRSGFTRLFKNTIGMGPMDYYQERRARYAARCLIESEESITDIAHRLGYSDAAHMTRLFKRLLGSTPSEYRKMALTKTDMP